MHAPPDDDAAIPAALGLTFLAEGEREAEHLPKQRVAGSRTGLRGDPRRPLQFGVPGTDPEFASPMVTVASCTRPSTRRKALVVQRVGAGHLTGSLVCPRREG